MKVIALSRIYQEKFLIESREFPIERSVVLGTTTEKLLAKKTANCREDKEVTVTTCNEVSPWDADNDASPFHYREHLVVSDWPRLWTIGDRRILARPLLGFFCSSRCPGDIILRTYDLARALRDAGVPVISGFHSPIEEECLDLLLRGRQPTIVCPARGIERLRLPAEWKNPIDAGRLLILSPFPSRHRRPTIRLAEQRNRLVGEIAAIVFVAHAAAGSKTEAFCRELINHGKTVWTFDSPSQTILRSLGASCFPSVQAIIDNLAGGKEPKKATEQRR